MTRPPTAIERERDLCEALLDDAMAIRTIREYSIMGIFLPNGSLVMKYGGQGAATGIKS